ncbi:MAG: hypothetical protein AAF944_24685 [Bacteroidota bacterium]
MNLIILKTDLTTKKKVKLIAPTLDHQPGIARWNVDTQDIDKVLRIEASSHLSEQKVLRLLQQAGVQGETLPD